MTKQDRRWVFTLNNYRPCDIDDVKGLPYHYLVYGKEKGESGTPHLQGFVTFKGKKSLKQLSKLVPRAHWEIAKAPSAIAAAYCKKGEQTKEEWEEEKDKGPTFGLNADVFEDGHVPAPGKRTDLLDMALMIKKGVSMKEVADIAPDTYIRNYRGLAAYKALQVEPHGTDDVRGIWLYGPPGTGKSHHARLFASAIGSVYMKAQNKWFDGYDGEDVILLDDLDSNALGHLLKIWADKYPCTGEIKGGMVQLRHKYIVVTSNYQPVDLWPADGNDPKNKAMCDAITRRFELIRVSVRCEQVPRLTKKLYHVDPETAGENMFDNSI